MTYFKKNIILFILFLGLISNFALFTIYKPENFLYYDLTRLEDYNYIGVLMPSILFYISEIFIIFILIGIITLLFIPINRKVILNKNANAKTIIEMKAIKSLILLELETVDYIKSNKVKISIFKRKKKIKGSITGVIVPYYGLDVNTEELLAKLVSSISLMFGIPEKSIHLKLYLKHMKANKNKKLMNRRVD